MTWVYRRNMAGGNYPPVKREMTVAVSQTLVRGDIVVLSGTTGHVAKAGDGTALVVGVMDEAVTTNASTTQTAVVQIATPSQVWRGTADANASGGVLNGTRTYDMDADGDLDFADTAGGSIQIIGTVDSNTDVEIQFTACVFG